MDNFNPDEEMQMQMQGMEGMGVQAPPPAPLQRDPRLVKAERRVVQEIISAYSDDSLQVPLSLRDSPAQIVFPVMTSPDAITDVPTGLSFADQLAGEVGAIAPELPFPGGDDLFAEPDPFAALEADTPLQAPAGDPFEDEFLL